MKNYKPGQQTQIDIVVKWLLAEAEKDECLKPHLENMDVLNMWEYILKRAREKSVKGSAMIEDSEVYGWAKHYALEDGKMEAAYMDHTPEVKPVVETKPVAEVKDEDIEKDDPEETVEEKEVVKPTPTKKNDKYGGFDLFSDFG